MLDKLTDHYIKTFADATRMLDYMLDHGESISGAVLGKDATVELMALVQETKVRLDAVEKRLRNEVADFYECDDGASTTNTDKELGYKIEIKKPVSVKLRKDIEVDDLIRLLGLQVVDTAFPAKREFSATGTKTLSPDVQAAVRSYTVAESGSMSVKVTKIIQ